MRSNVGGHELTRDNPPKLFEFRFLSNIDRLISRNWSYQSKIQCFVELYKCRSAAQFYMTFTFNKNELNRMENPDYAVN